ncbi:MAG TPA: hypothetical protein VMZ91_08155 [Candidatus Paceibacterota bacterium]|nr:hypothetical protein [Candidatus Paceibacterota bacterium]
MFSLKEKQFIAKEIENLLLNLNHPEMPKEKPAFHLRVEGKEDWSWAEIKPNWTFSIDNPPNINSFNEQARDLLKND